MLVDLPSLKPASGHFLAGLAFAIGIFFAGLVQAAPQAATVDDFTGLVRAKSYYDVFGLKTKDVNSESLRASVRRARLLFHPDLYRSRQDRGVLTSEQAHAAMDYVLGAANVLSNPHLRASYDQRLLSSEFNLEVLEKGPSPSLDAFAFVKSLADAELRSADEIRRPWLDIELSLRLIEACLTWEKPRADLANEIAARLVIAIKPGSPYLESVETSIDEVVVRLRERNLDASILTSLRAKLRPSPPASGDLVVSRRRDIRVDVLDKIRAYESVQQVLQPACVHAIDRTY